ncbi:OmpH family outer membrane protein [Rhodohalobacter sp. 8-1]|uniref:OmpH family outer membrane protein n=1 Tax=Rhodohalobacter sp. 8-1 TaxID=3131972 RepID=UPI0030ED566F
MKTAKIFLLTTLVAITGFMFAPAAQAQTEDMKIGFVDPRAVLERMPEMRAVQQRLQNFAERKQQELSQKETELQTEIELYQQKVGVISESARQSEEERLSQLDTEFRQLQSEVEREFQQQRAQLMSPLLNQIQQSINTVAETKSLDYVLNTTTSNGDVIILYVSEEIQNEFDITDAVMQDLGI